MADTERTLAALQALFPDNSSGEISPQDLRDFLISAVLKLEIIEIRDPDGTEHVKLQNRDNAAADVSIWFTDNAGTQPVGIEVRDIVLYAHVMLASISAGFLDLKSPDNTSFAPMRALWHFIVNQNDPNNPVNSVRLANIDSELRVSNYAASALLALRALRLGVTDGVAEPGTVTGVAQIYVDTADGDLKVKFGDGTVKTIATDT